MMKKLLILTPRFPYPVIGGDRLRIYQLCKALSNHYELTLLSLCESKFEMEMELPDNVFSHVHRVYFPKWKSYLSTLLAIPTRTPLQVAYYRCSAFDKELKRLLSQHDATVSHLIRVGDYLINKSGIHVLEMTDAISLNYQRVKSVSRTSSLKSIIYSLEQSRLEHYERNVLSHFDFASLVSSVDRDFLFPDVIQHDKVLVCSNGVDTDELKYTYRPIDRAKPVEIIFIGNMSSLQNMDAALWFSKNVMPILAEKGQFIFKVIGRISEDNKAKLLYYPNVVVTGSVDNVFLSAASGHIAVCPMRLGAGIQNKVLEYMSFGLPCITSTIGFEGIGAVNKQHLLIADTVKDYVDIIESIILNPESTRLMTENARVFVQQNFSWDSRLAPFIVKLEQLLSRK